ncbi:MAG: hypothetical protein WDO71_06215 [Bacteroidota bacterium]
MPFYYSFFLIMVLSLVIFMIRTLILRKRNVPVELFLEALRNENSGHFEEAVITYENALSAVGKSRFNSYLRIRINEKLKVLRTIIEYKNNLHIIR